LDRINVTQSFLPPKEEYIKYLDKIWDNHWLTNNGPLVLELQEKLKSHLSVNHLLFTGNGTIAIQLAIKALNITGDIITTPFSYCATTTSILWENCNPIFVDIDPTNFNIDANKIEASITPNTKAIMATHVYGIPCDVEKIEEIAKKYELKVIYDAAHAFGCKINGRSLLDYGDISTCSFHATKVFHTIEGGAVVCQNKEIEDKLILLRSFGHIYDDYFTIGINGKNSEFHAAMGLCNLPLQNEIISKRKEVFEKYDSLLNWEKLKKPFVPDTNFEYNFAYYPILIENENVTELIIQNLGTSNIFPRRYFYPSLNTLTYLSSTQSCPISEEISKNVLSLPLYPDLGPKIIETICSIINSTL
jgi:dTDP-4-amino-4,6-dideoxygalactose transaminase